LGLGCGDDTGIAASDGPIPDAPIPDARPIDAPLPPDATQLQSGDPCGSQLDGGAIEGECGPGLLCCLGRQQLTQHTCAAPAAPNDAGIGIGQCALADLTID